MPPNSARSPTRLLAPLALLVVALAVALIVLGSGGADDGSGTAAPDVGRRATPERPESQTRSPERRARYTVKTGDTLSKIAEQSGVEVDVLQELNPDIDPQALVAGQKIKLRE
ncbi:MAG: LysM peptidoglycan-binding domain-containing protein [Thermoleophilaceae bacterium]